MGSPWDGGGTDASMERGQVESMLREDPNNPDLQAYANRIGAKLPQLKNRQDSFLTASRVNTGDAGFDERILGAMSPEQRASFQKYDPNSFEYGGSQAAGDAEAHRLNQMAGYMRTSRPAPVIDQTGMNASLAQALAARGQQSEAAGMFQQAGAGMGPTVAPAQMSLANALAAQQGSQMLAQGSRGPAGAAAMRAAALQGTGQMMGQNALQAALSRSSEQFGGMQGYQGTTNAMFGGDMHGAQTTANMAGAQSDLSAQSQAQNDAMERYYAAQRASVLGKQQQGRIAREQFQGGEVRQASGLVDGVGRDAALRAGRENENRWAQGSAAAGAVGAYADGKGK